MVASRFAKATKMKKSAPQSSWTRTAQSRLCDKLRRFRTDGAGNVALMFGLAMVPMVGAVGVAVDYSRAATQRTQVQAALDSAALAGAQQLGAGDKEVRDAVKAFLAVNMPSQHRNKDVDIQITDDRKRVSVTMDGKVDAQFVTMFGIKKMDISVTSEATLAIDNSEVVFALDTTGTMRNHMPALREGAKEALKILYRNAVDKQALKVGLVPYVTAVNVGAHPAHMNWMDTNADSRFHGENFENVSIGDYRCDPPPPPPSKKEEKEEKKEAKKDPAPPSPPSPPSPPPPPPPPKKKSPDLGALELEEPVRTAMLTNSLLDRVAGVADAVLDTLAITGAQAAGAWPYGRMDETTAKDCANGLKTPKQVNHFELFSAMNVKWKGCVEARPGPYDVTDDPPARGAPDTLFVPYLWPDEHDTHPGVRNNYLVDKINWPSWVKENDPLKQAWIWKYNNGPAPNIDDASFITRGPNASCPDPIVPLTHKQANVEGAVDKLRAYGASGTNIAEGLAWAWRVISPGEPFAEGAPYDPKKNKKFIVLMTDGFNEIVEQNVPEQVWWNKSDYTSFGYASKARYGTSDPAAITRELDRRLAEVCRSVKAKEIQIFTLLFDPVGYTQSSDVENLLRNCATSKDRHVFKASSQSELVRAFQTIANEITKLRLAR